MRRLLRVTGAAALTAALLLLALAIAGLRLLRPADDEWQTSLSIGPWQTAVSLPGLIRIATHPLAAPVLDGRVLNTRFGRWQLHRRSDTAEAICAPCVIQVHALGPAPLQLARARIVFRPLGAGQFKGQLTFAEGPHEASLDWNGKLDARGAEFDLRLTPTPVSKLVGAFAHHLPEAPQLQITGTVAATVRVRWPQGVWTVQPSIHDFSVAGLGTERLRDAQLPAACRIATDDGEPITGWLPRALVAAEDARFFEHPGYDVGEMLAATQHNQQAPGHWRGGSTLTQQLAKLAFTGDDRSAMRKLRELLYAVEMERTLGKARILQLYLALAPWGEGVCGAERAAQIYLGKRASRAGPVSSAWLASLLRNPDIQLRALADERHIDRDRMRQILAGMRPMSAAQRALAETQVEDWMP